MTTVTTTRPGSVRLRVVPGVPIEIPLSPFAACLRVASLAAACTLVAAPLLLAQSTTGLVFGTVTDATDAAVPSATVQLVDTRTGLVRQLQTGRSGEYSIALPPGVYRVRVTAAGFALAEFPGVSLSVSDKVHVDAHLRAGTAQEVTVSAKPSPTNSESSELSRVISEKEISGLPLNNRNLTQLYLLTTGAVQSKPNTAGSFSFNGSSQYGSNISLDGTDASAVEASTPLDPAGSGRLNTISLEAVREFQLETATFSAVNGRATGAAINIISKSGTDLFHGTAFEYFRNNYLDALNRFATSATPLRQNQFGGSLGGPVLKNRFLFFAAYEGSRAKVGQIFTANVPTATLRSAAPAAYAPYFAALPLPQTAVSSTTGVYRRQDNSLYNEDLFDGRMDRITSRSDLFARYSLARTDSSTPQLFPTNRLLYPSTQNIATLGQTFSFGSRLVNDVRLGVNRYNLFRRNQTFTQGLGSISLSGFAITNTEGVLHFVDDVYTVLDTLTWNRGRHTVRAGFEERRLDAFRQQRSNPIYTYTNLTKFNNNTPDSVTLTYGHTGDDLIQWQSGVYLQDDWRASRRLVLNLGVRWDYFSPFAEKHGHFYNTGADPFGAFNPAGAPLYNKDWNNFQPRVGFAWDTTGTQQTVLRGGVGLYTLPLPAYFIWNGATIDPRIPASATYAPTDLPTPLPGSPSPLAYPLVGTLARANADLTTAAASNIAPAVVNRNTIQQNERTPYTYLYNLTMEQALGKGFLFQLGYAGSRALKSPGAQALNLIDPGTGKRPNPFIAQINLTTGLNRRYYDSMQVAVRRRIYNGFAFNVNYTWAKLIILGNEDAFGPGAVQDWSNPRGSRGPGALDVRHALETDITWLVPIGGLNRNTVARTVLGGWSLTNIDTVRSGYPVNFLTGQDIRGNGFSATQRPNYNGLPIYPATRGIATWFNKAAFSNPTAKTFGNVGYNLGRGPNRVQVDVGVQRRFALGERAFLDFRGEAFNLPNHVNYFLPDGNINSATFGQITSADNPRQLQLSLRVGF